MSEAASDALLARKEELARAIVEALYADMPRLMEKYGERGRAKCLQDMHYNLEQLAPAVALGEPALFARYVAWLRDMLAARGIAPEEVRRSLELTRDILRQRLDAEQADAAGVSIREGLRVLDPRLHT